MDQAKYRFIRELVKEGYDMKDLVAMSLLELRDLYEEANPTIIETETAHPNGGTMRRTVVLGKVA